MSVRFNHVKTFVLTLALAGAFALLCGPASAQVIFTENFSGFTGGTFNGGQFQSNKDLAFGGNLSAWSKAGAGTVHVVDRANLTGSITNPRDFAVMLYQDNVITLNSGIAGSNNAGQSYTVSFQDSPAVYQAGGQQTLASDRVLIELLRPDNSVLASFTHAPGAWAGDMAFNPASFNYIGDGTGNLRFRVGPGAVSFNQGRFAGAIDNLQLQANAVPEPSSLVAMLLAGLAAVLYIRGKKQ